MINGQNLGKPRAHQDPIRRYSVAGDLPGPIRCPGGHGVWFFLLVKCPRADGIVGELSELLKLILTESWLSCLEMI